MIKLLSFYCHNTFKIKITKNQLSPLEIRNINKKKLLLMLLFLVFLLSIVNAICYINTSNDLFSKINLFFATIYLSLFIIGQKYSFRIASLFFILATTLDIFLNNNLLGPEAGIQMYYLALLFSMIILYDVQQKKELIILFSFITLVIIYTLFFSFPLFINIKYSPSEIKNLYIVNFLGCIFIVALAGYFYSINIEGALEKLGKEKETLDKIFNKNFEALLLIDSNTRQIIEANEKTCNLFEIDKNDIIGLDSNVLHSKLFTSEEKSNITRTLENGQKYQEDIEFITFNKKYFWGNAAASLIEIDNKNYILYRILDISQTKKINRQIVDVEASIPGILYSFYMDYNGKSGFDYISADCYKLIGKTQEEILSSNNLFGSIFKVKDFHSLAERVRISAKNMSLLNWEGEVLFENGQSKWIEVFSQPSRNSNNTITWNGVMVDSTEKVKLRKELLLSKIELDKTYAAKEDFLATMSHEIRTPLNSVIGMAYLLQENNTDPSQNERIEVLKFSADNLLGLINDVLDYTKISEGKLILENRNFNLVILLNNIHKSYLDKYQSNGGKLILDINSNVPIHVVSDELRLTQILNNLISNAIKFTPNGEILISLNYKKISNKNIKLLFEIKDNGIGIESDKIENIFDRFIQANTNTQRKFGGSGLGLSICKLLVEQFEGNINAKSELGKGTTFAFEIPVTIGTNEVNITETVEFHDYFLVDKNILLAEDNDLNILVAKSILERWNINIDIAKNGSIAVDMAKNKNYDLILMDMQMPEMNGLEAASEIRKFNPNIPIIALTANVLSDIQADFEAAGINDFVAKPFKPEILKEKLSVLMQNYLLHQ